MKSIALLYTLILFLITPISGCGSKHSQKKEATNSPIADGIHSVEELENCDAYIPSFECLQKIFVPLSSAIWPFPVDGIKEAINGPSFYVTPTSRIVIIHSAENAGCYFSEYIYTFVEREGCGRFHFVGGHPITAECSAEGGTNCVDRVAPKDNIDIGLKESPPQSSILKLYTSAPQIGDRVFMIGSPKLSVLPTLSDKQASYFSSLSYPLVSTGYIKAIEGHSLIISNLGYPGNSGGPVLNEHGEVIATVSTKVKHLRDYGVLVEEEYLDRYTVVTRIDSQMKEIISGLLKDSF